MNEQELIEAFIKMVRLLQGLSDDQIRLFMRLQLSKNPEYLEDLTRAFDLIKMKEELRQLKSSPQRFARRIE